MDSEQKNMPVDSPVSTGSQPQRTPCCGGKGKIIMIAVIVLVILAAAFYGLKTAGVLDGLLGKGPVTSQEAADKAIKYINNVILSGRGTASLVEVTSESCLYKVKIKVGSSDFDTYITQNGELFFPEGRKIAATDLEPQPEVTTTLANFSVAKGAEVCQENGKPLVYFFGSATCPHCQWEHPIVEAVVKDFGDTIAFHNNMDSTADQDIFSQYSDGSIPAVVIGCKYYRVGSGENLGEEKEANALKAIICKVTGNQPEGVCSSVSELMTQVSE